MALGDEEKKLGDEQWAKDLVDIVKHYDKADESARSRQVRKWRKLMNYWDSIQYLWWSELEGDWRTPDAINQNLDDPNFIDPALYAKVINIYRAHGEVVISAMSATVPSVLFPPDDADDPDDVLTAKSYTKLSKVIQKHNQGELLLIKALYILFNQGLVCGYNENKEDKDYGVVIEDITEPKRVMKKMYLCPDCGEMLDEQNEVLEDEPENVRAASIIEEPIDSICPTCSESSGGEVRVNPEVVESESVEDQVTGQTEKPKTREIVEVYGPLNVKVPTWIRKQKDAPYIILETEEHYAKLQATYPDSAKDIKPGESSDRWEHRSRGYSSTSGEAAEDLILVQRVWFRPWAFGVLGNEDEILERVQVLKNKFKDGGYCVILNNELIVEALEDNMDEHWTLSESPLSDVIHAQPIGTPLVPIQELTNELANLTLENIEHSIPETFADRDTLDFEQYSKSEARPGQVYPVTRTPGDSLSSSFHEIKGGTLSREVELFGDRLEKNSQFVVGSLPSVFGGHIKGSDTAREYEISRNAALQRLSITWRLITSWWTQVVSKSVRSYAQNIMGDEHWAEKNGSSFVNVWIKRAEMTGKVGDAVAEGSESLPVSWNQKRDVIINLLGMGNEMINAIVQHPENASFIARLIGLPELFIPGDDDRNKQLMEIGKLIMEEPIEVPGGLDPETGMEGPPEMLSTIQVDPDVDNHIIEAEICGSWLKSDVGQDAKESNPGGYANVLSHKKEHDFFVAQAEMAEAMRAEEQAGKEEKGNGDLEEIGAGV